MLISLSQREREWLVSAVHPVPLPLGEGDLIELTCKIYLGEGS